MAQERKLSQKQLKFCNEYLKGVSATRAALTAGYSKKTARAIATENLSKPAISDYIQARRAKQLEKSENIIDRIQAEYARIAFFDIRRAFNPDGSMIALKDLDDDTAAAVAAIEVTEEMVRGRKTGTTKKVKFSPKLQALEGLGRILGVFAKDNEQAAPVVNIPVDVAHLTLKELKELKYGKPNG